MGKAHEAAERLVEVHARYTRMLMQKKHVVGVSIGRSARHFDEVVLVVMVDQKVPEAELDPVDRIPSQLEGVGVEVRESSGFEAY